MSSSSGRPTVYSYAPCLFIWPRFLGLKPSKVLYYNRLSYMIMVPSHLHHVAPPVHQVVDEGALLRLERVSEGERIVCLFNLSPDPLHDIPIPQGETLCSVNSVTSDSLGAYGALVVRV